MNNKYTKISGKIKGLTTEIIPPQVIKQKEGLPPLKSLKDNIISPKNRDTSSFDLYDLQRGSTTLDLDVHLPSYNKNLQRGLVWSNEQKVQLIMTMLTDGTIPPVCCWKPMNQPTGLRYHLQVIDGKQRLSTILSFLNDEFSINFNGIEFYYSEFDEDYKNKINSFSVKYYIMYEHKWAAKDKDVLIISQRELDDLKIKWFRQINFGGTAQDKEHLFFAE
jgi:uncharacterized protein with ParB-like and HNH nuclease domain